MAGANTIGEMPSASASYAPSRRRSGLTPGPGRDRRAGPAGRIAVGRVRWDRLGRIAMLFVLLALVFLYLSTGLRMLSTWRQSHRTSSKVASMEREHRRLVEQHNRLSSQSTLEKEARQLGMMRPGEQPYVVSNLPEN